MNHTELLLITLVLYLCTIPLVSSFTIVTTSHQQQRQLSYQQLQKQPFSVRCQIESPLTSLSSSSVQSDETEKRGDESEQQKQEGSYQKPKWMKCINGVAPKTGSLNEIVSNVADVSLEQANYLIAIGAVWAKMDAPTTDELLDQYNFKNVIDPKVLYSDLPKGWKNRNSDDNISDMYNAENDEEVDLDVYIKSMENRRYSRIMVPSVLQQGTDLRIYPHPRRFAACKELDETKLLHEDTTFIIVDKPPMLPTQPDASNYVRV
jgi:hypothetical protein